MAKYYGNWSTNDGNMFSMFPIESNNKRSLEAKLKQACKDNLMSNTDIGCWSISLDTDEDTIVSTGIIKY